MNEVSTCYFSLPAMTDEAVNRTRSFENTIRTLPQIDMPTAHVIHAGMYARTIVIPAETILTGALIKIATLLIVQGDVTVYIGDEVKELRGYNVLPASANRKQAFLTRTSTYLTMIFACDAETIKEAEDMFTDEGHLLLSRQDDAINQITITGD